MRVDNIDCYSWESCEYADINIRSAENGSVVIKIPPGNPNVNVSRINRSTFKYVLSIIYTSRQNTQLTNGWAVKSSVSSFQISTNYLTASGAHYVEDKPIIMQEQINALLYTIRSKKNTATFSKSIFSYLYLSKYTILYIKLNKIG